MSYDMAGRNGHDYQRRNREEAYRLRLEHRKILSMQSMMEKGTKIDDLMKLRKEPLDPLRDEITKLEGELSLLCWQVPFEGAVP